jgi:hypothetical protein
LLLLIGSEDGIELAFHFDLQRSHLLLLVSA